MPVYLLLDVSGSMSGAPIMAVEQGVQLLHNELMGQPQAVEMVHLSVITFASSVNQVVPLTPIVSFRAFSRRRHIFGRSIAGIGSCS
jgi:uncharacterized protein YegL